jgi:hypothetical protein
MGGESYNQANRFLASCWHEGLLEVYSMHLFIPTCKNSGFVKSSATIGVGLEPEDPSGCYRSNSR